MKWKSAFKCIQCCAVIASAVWSSEGGMTTMITRLGQCLCWFMTFPKKKENARCVFQTFMVWIYTYIISRNFVVIIYEDTPIMSCCGRFPRMAYDTMQIILFHSVVIHRNINCCRGGIWVLATPLLWVNAFGRWITTISGAPIHSVVFINGKAHCVHSWSTNWLTELLL